MGEEFEKRTRIADVMFELLDLSRAEQLLKDVWDKAPPDVKVEVAKLFANRVLAHVQVQTNFVTLEELAKSRSSYDAAARSKTELQIAAEEQIAVTAKNWLKENQEKVQAAVIAHMEEKWPLVVQKIADDAMYTATKNLRENISKLFINGRGY